MVWEIESMPSLVNGKTSNPKLFHLFGWHIIEKNKFLLRIKGGLKIKLELFFVESKINVEPKSYLEGSFEKTAKMPPVMFADSLWLKHYTVHT